MKNLIRKTTLAFMPLFIMLVSAAAVQAAPNSDTDSGRLQQETVHVRLSNHARKMAEVVVFVYDGARQLMPSGTQILYRLIDGDNVTVFSGFIDSPVVVFEHVPVRGNGSDLFRVIVSRKGYDDGGVAGVHVKPDAASVVNLMEIPHKAVFDFSRAHWQELSNDSPEYWRIIAAGATSDDAAARRWEELIAQSPNKAACLLNIFTAMAQLQLPSQKTLLAYYKELVWDKSMAQDRFFAWVSPDLENQIRLAAETGEFVSEPDPAVLHPGATAGWKQVALDEADLNPTFHDDDRRVIDGKEYVLFEVDIDYYKDALAHTFGEVIPNMITGRLSDPMKVYQLRFNAGFAAGLPEFEPPETVIAAGGKLNGRVSKERSYRNLRLLKFWRYLKK